MKNNLFRTGQKFVVVEPTTDSAYTAGSTGYMAFVEKQDNSFANVARVQAVIIRRGKGGKERIECLHLYFPIFRVDDKAFQKVMPEKGMRRGYVHPEIEGPAILNVMDLSDIEYLGWAIACIKAMRWMVEKCKHHQWPSSQQHIFNKLGRVAEYFNADPENLGKIKNQLASPDSRVGFLAELRPAFASLVRVNLSEAVLVAEMLHTAAEFLEFTNSGKFIPKDAKDKKNEFHFTDNNKMLKDNIQKHKKRLEQLTKLSKQRTKKF